MLKELRIDLAKRDLADRDLSISQIAWLLGYKDVSSFTHAFYDVNQEQTSSRQTLMPALRFKTDRVQHRRDVRPVPILLQK
jgi:AraC-like DNA-binding protein